MYIQFTKHDRLFCMLFIFNLIAGFTLGGILYVTDAQVPEADIYAATLNEDSKVYDGDTIQDVFIEIGRFMNEDSPGEVLWPGILLKGQRLYVVTDIRLAGIDTPEKRPRKAGRTEASRAREKAAAAVAQNTLYNLLDDADMEFDVVNPKLGKYAGRIVADVIVDGINASDYMIEQGLAIPYEGGTKIPFDDWYTGD